MTVLSIDPGESIGFAEWTLEGDLLYKDKYDLGYFMQKMEWVIQSQTVHTMIVEQWAFDPGKTQRGNKMISSQVIGMATLAAYMGRAELVFQDRRVLKIAALHAGVEIPKNGHFDDDVSAYLHGFYYFETKGILEPKPL